MARSSHIKPGHFTGARLLFCVVIVLASCGAPSAAPTSIRQLTSRSDRELDNLIAFTRLLGYVQYFHPSDQAANTNWEGFALQGLVVAKSAVDTSDLASRLSLLFQPVAPTVRVFETGKDPSPSTHIVVPAEHGSLQVVAWWHHGFDGNGLRQPIYYSERIYKPVEEGNLPSTLPDPRKPLLVDLGGGVSALIPLALYVEDRKTLPHEAPHAQPTPSAPATPEGKEKTRRLATVMLAWNVFQHFYPYFDVVQTDWRSTLRNSLTAAEAARDEDEFLDVLREMVAQLKDGHGGVQYPPPALYRPPFGWDWVENQLVITFVEEDANGQLQRGDRVTAIDGQPIASALAAQERVISGATPQWIRFSALKNLLEGPPNSTIRLTLQPAVGVTYQATLKRTVYLSASDEYLFTEQRPPGVSELQPGIWYVDLTRISDAQFNENIPNLTKAAGIIFDMRGYPLHVGLEPIGHLIDQPVAWPQLNIPIITYPDQQNLAFDKILQSVEPIAPHFPGKIVFLTDGRAISYAESYLGIIESNKIAEIVGEPTAGTNGNMTGFILFKRYTLWFTGMQVLKLDGSPHHGVGIQPTVPVSRTLRGVREGQDEFLERAIQILTQK